MGSIFVGNAGGQQETQKEIFVPVLEYNSEYGDKPVLEIDDGNSGFVQFYIPHDFGSLVTASIECMPQGDAADADRQIQLTADYGRSGNVEGQFHSVKEIFVDFSGLEDFRTRLDVSAILGDVLPRHNGSIKITHVDTGDIIYYFGFRLAYIPLEA